MNFYALTPDEAVLGKRFLFKEGEFENLVNDYMMKRNL